MQAPGSTVPGTPDRECLEAWARHRDVASLQTLVERYIGLVHSSALRRTDDAAKAATVTRTVFLVLSRRAHRLRANTVLSGWLFHVTSVACQKLMRTRFCRLRRLWQWISRRPRPAAPTDASLWDRVAAQMDRALERLRTKQRNAVLLCVFLKHDFASAAKVLRTSERRVEKRVGRGLKKLAKRLGNRRAPVHPDALASACAAEGCAATVPEGLFLDILQSMDAHQGQRPVLRSSAEKRSDEHSGTSPRNGNILRASTAEGGPSLKLARRTLNTLAWLRWRQRIVIGWATLSVLIAILGGIAVYIDSLSGYSRLISEGSLWAVRYHGWRVAEVARPWPANAATPRLHAGSVRNAQDLYRTTNIWHAHLRFTREQWKALELRRIGPMPNAIRPDGMRHMRNPKARRSGVAGVLGFEFDWTQADFELGGVAFTNVAARVKGNVRSLYEPTRSYKVDLNKFAPGQKLGGLDELTFHSLIWDYSCLAETLAYEFFREAGVPAPRTAYAWLTTSVTTQWEQKPMGLYMMVEVVDNDFAAERFGSKVTPIFKPVTYTLFEHLGDDWSAYAPIYDLKTKATPEQLQCVIDFARLVSSGTDAEFAARVGDFLDLDAFARFLAGQVLLPSYDGILSDGQNFYMYLDPRSNKFGFIPWDLDGAWGQDWIVSRPEQERASIWHPWLGKNRFLERVMAVEEFRRIYRTHLEDSLGRLYVPERLHRRMDEISAVIRDPIAAQSAFRLDKFEQTVGLKPVHPSPGEDRDSFNWPAHEMKRFISNRATSVRRQLDGKSKGLILKYPKEK